MEDGNSLELAARTIAASVAAGASLANPDLGAVATFLTPMSEVIVQQALGALGWRRRRHVAEVVTTAAEVRSEGVDELIARALEDESSQELFVRVATAAQDAALKEKRIALGRTLAAGLNGDEVVVNDELLFVRAIADLDAPHIQLLRVMSQPRAGIGQMADHALMDGWTRANLALHVPPLVRHLSLLLATLEQHGFVEWQNEGTWAGLTERSYGMTDAGRTCLERLAVEAEKEVHHVDVESEPED